MTEIFERKELLQKHLTKIRREAAAKYLKMIANVYTESDLDEYSRLRQRVTELETDLKVIDSLINEKV